MNEKKTAQLDMVQTLAPSVLQMRQGLVCFKVRIKYSLVIVLFDDMPMLTMTSM